MGPCVYLIVFFLPIVFCELTDVSVTTSVGTFTGFSDQIELDGGIVKISKFLGIPFAEPPVGDLRFRKPVPKAALSESLKTQEYGKQCLQINFFGSSDERSEDCLFLNIYKPEIDGNQDILPVMVWIHGGGFIFGASTQYIADALAANGPVIVVTLNYRLTVWGFLSTEDANAPGNYGLWDQHLAIKWVHDNIVAFGGDASRVTIFGESAGSASVTFQGMFPENKGLFQRMIAQSGTATSDWCVRKNPKADAEIFASLVGCNDSNSKDMIECLRRLPSEKINSTINDMSNGLFQLPMPFLPSVDNDFVEKLPRDILDINGNLAEKSRGVFASFDLIIGLNSGEGGFMVSPLYGVNIEPENFLPNKTFFDETLVPILNNALYGKNTSSILNEAVVAAYTDWEDPENPESIRQLFCDMCRDSMFHGGTYRTINTHAQVSDRQSYMYYFNLLPYKSIFPRPSWFNKAMHGDDLLYVFGNMVDMSIPGFIYNRDLQNWEKEAAKNIMTLWTNFAKTGNPNQPRDIGVDWLPFTPASHRYLEISNDVTSSNVKERLLERTATFWDTFMPSLVEATSGSAKESLENESCSRDTDCQP